MERRIAMVGSLLSVSYGLLLSAVVELVELVVLVVVVEKRAD